MVNSRKVFLFVTAGVAFFAVTITATWIFFDDAPVAEAPKIASAAPTVENRNFTPVVADKTNNVEVRSEPLSDKIETGPVSAFAPKASCAPRTRPVTVQEAEAEYLRAATDEDREAAARQLATMDTTESVQILGQLFGKARAYPEKVAIVGALTDAQGEGTLEGKLAILRLALAAGQVKPVRSAALDVAAQLDDQRAVEMLRQAAKHDPDAELRELAKAALPDK